MALAGFSDDIIEKMERLCDLLAAIQKSKFVTERLSLYGGTALNLIYLDQPRLSEDLDFNYRHIDEEDWGKVREKIDHDLKWIINSLGYNKKDVKINSLYNFCRFHIKYVSKTGIRDDIKIEIGYMRRFPILEKDCIKTFNHLAKGEKIIVMTPIKEELFANKFVTMIARSKSYLNLRDIFDVYSISKQKFDHNLFIDLVALEALLMDQSFLQLSQIKERLVKGKHSGRIEHLIIEEFTDKDIIPAVIKFSEKTIQELAKYEINDIMERFYFTGELELEKFKFKEKLHHDLPKHPQLLWLRKKKGYKKEILK
jgi:predicted nucleotidyltransferase component of viral defense system